MNHRHSRSRHHRCCSSCRSMLLVHSRSVRSMQLVHSRSARSMQLEHSRLVRSMRLVHSSWLRLEHSSLAQRHSFRSLNHD